MTLPCIRTLLLGLFSLAGMPALAAPVTVTAAGSFQSEAGCPGDWQPDCALTQLARGPNDEVWRRSFALPAGNYEYKVAINGSWTENYGAGATANGPNIGLTLPVSDNVRFYYDETSHWVTDDRRSRIVTAVGSFQSELGCASDWAPNCLQSWLQDIDGDGTYTFLTDALPVGNYAVKAALSEGWTENYGAGGVAGGANIDFAVAAAGQRVLFNFVSSMNLLTVTVGAGAPGGDPNPVPEPAAPSLALLALALLVGQRHMRKVARR